MKTSFTIFGPCVAKPRQTRSDRWKQRPCVVAYRKWADEARMAATGSPLRKVEGDVIGVFAFCHFAMPESWSAEKKARMAGRMHRERGDVDNLGKSLLDALFEEDKTISLLVCQKFWTDEEPRMDVFLLVP